MERMGIDRLRFSALGAQIGAVKPANIEGTTSYSLQTDYGEIAPRWRVVFTTTYWGSQFTDRQVRSFADSLKRAIEDPTGDAEVVLGDITISDVALGADLRRILGPSTWFWPYVGGGFSAHVVNADGRLIDGTFVERALDNIAVGVTGMAGLDVRLLRHLSVGVQARYDLLSLARFGSLRVGASWFFDPPQRPAPR